MVKWIVAVFMIILVVIGGVFAHDMSKSFLPHFMMYNKTPIDPYCMGQLATDMEGTRRTEPVSLAACTKEGRENYTSHFSKNDFYFVQSMERPNKDWTEHLNHSYHYLGGKEERFFVATTMNGGGTGQFSTIMALKREGDSLVSVEEYAGGDRCFGGIDNATVEKDGTLRYGRFVTSADLYDHENIPENERLSDLSFCAVCCIGTVDYTKHTATGYTITPENLTLDDGMEPHQICFNKAMLAHTKAKGNIFSKEEMRSFLLKTASDCQS